MAPVFCIIQIKDDGHFTLVVCSKNVDMSGTEVFRSKS